MVMFNVFELPRYDSFKESGFGWLGTIPSSWRMKRLKYFSSLKARIGFHGLNSSDFIDDGAYCITGTDFKNGVVDYSNCYFVSEYWYQLDKNIQVRNGDVLITKDGTIGKTAVVEGLERSATLNSGVFLLRPIINYRYFYWLLKSSIFIEQVTIISRGSTINHLYERDFKNFSFTVPAEPQQSKIARFLDKKTSQIDEAIAIKEQLIALLKERKQIIIQKSVTQGLDPTVPMKDSGVDWIGEIPAHWSISKIGHYARVYNGSTPSRDSRRYWEGGTIPWMSSGKVNEYLVSTPSEFITESAFRECSLRIFPKGTVLVGIVGQGKTRGTSARLAIDAAINQNVAGIIPSEELLSEFLHQYLIQSYEEVRNQGQGSNQEALNCQILSAFKIAFPPVFEQQDIVDFIGRESEAINKAVSLQLLQIEKLKEYKTTLINSAVTGKIRITPDMVEA